MTETFIPRSENISQVVYDGDAKLVTVTFKDGRAYEYRGVDPTVFAAWQRAPSAGQFFYRQVRDRYSATEV